MNVPDLEKKLRRFTETITSDAAAESKTILEEVRVQREASLLEAEDQALSESYRHIQQEVARIRVENGRRLSRRERENKKALFLRNSELSGQVLAAVRERLVAYVQSPAYEEHLRDMVRRASAAFGEEYFAVALGTRDMPIADRLKGVLPSTCASVSADPSIHLGGLVATTPTRRLDLTFDANWQEWKDRFFAEEFHTRFPNRDGQEDGSA